MSYHAVSTTSPLVDDLYVDDVNKHQNSYRYLKLTKSTNDDGILEAELHINTQDDKDASDYDLWQKSHWVKLCQDHFFSCLQLQLLDGIPSDATFSTKLATFGIPVLVENFVTNLEIFPGQMTARAMKAFWEIIGKAGLQMKVKLDGHLDHAVVYEINPKASQGSNQLTFKFHWAKEEISTLEDLTVVLEMGLTNPNIVIKDVNGLIQEINSTDIKYFYKNFLNNRRWSEWFMSLDLAKVILAMVRILLQRGRPQFLDKMRKFNIYLPMMDHVEDKNITLAVNNRLLPSIKSLSEHWATDVQIYTIVENEINPMIRGQAQHLGFKDLEIT